MAKNPLCEGEDSGLIPGQGTKIPRAMEQLSLPATTTESVCHIKDPAGCNKDPVCSN